MDAELFQRIADAVPGAMYLMSADFSRYVYINPPIERLIGYPAEKFIAEGPAFMASLVHPEDLVRITHRHNQRVEELNRAGVAQQDRYTHIDEYRVRHRDGSWKWVRSSAIVFDRTPSGEILTILGVAQDITEQKALEHRIGLSERMASVGRLAAGMAHEINNPLAHLMGSIELATERLDSMDPGEWRQCLADMQVSAERIERLVRDLKLFSRPGDEECLEPVALELAFESSARLAMTEIRPRARLVREYANVPAVLANESRLGQVILNLLINAAQAIPDGKIEQNEIRLVTRVADDGRVIAEVRDSGVGMAPEVLRQVFDPFFTTKPVGKGMGLGLSIAFQIVQSFGGTLEAESILGQGSVFRVTLPAAVDASAKSPAQRDDIASPARRVQGPAGRVLVVDDDLAVAEIIEAALCHEFEVLVCTEVEDALKQLASSSSFDLILCDMIMPRMSGADFHKMACKLDPGLAARFVFMTGGAFTEHTQEFLKMIPNQVLQKPFRIHAVRQFVRDFVANRLLNS